MRADCPCLDAVCLGPDLTSLTQADLPDPEAVLANPGQVQLAGGGGTDMDKASTTRQSRNPGLPS
jgi:hypothetical protein